jgi:hypothetical protein
LFVDIIIIADAGKRKPTAGLGRPGAQVYADGRRSD